MANFLNLKCLGLSAVKTLWISSRLVKCSIFQESERKAYNPKSFCRAYMMDHQPLNTAEQKDMTEFFTDLISKMEDMSPSLRCLVKELFGGILTNNVVSLDCPHVSRTKEEFYTVRCQVSDLRNLNVSFQGLDFQKSKDLSQLPSKLFDVLFLGSLDQG